MGLLSWLGGSGRRRTGPPEGAAPAADTPGDAAPGTDTGPSGAWRDLPPLQRTSDGLGLLTDPGGFRASLDTWQDISLSRPLVHLVSPEAPAGLLYGVVSPVAAAASVSEAVQAPAPGPPPRGTGPARTPVAVQRAPDAAALTFVADTGSAPVRHLAGLPFAVGRPPAPEHEPRPPVRDLPVAPPTPAQPTPVQRSAEQPWPPHHPLGVGEPLSRLPFTAQREPAGRSSPAPARPEADGVELSPPSAPFEAEAAPAVPEGPVAPAHPLLGDDPLVPAVEAPAPASAPGAGPTHRLPSEAPDSVRPLVVVGVQRLPSAVTPAPPVSADGLERTAGLTGERRLPLFTGTAPPAAVPAPAVVVARWAVGTDAPGPPRESDPAPGAPAPATRTVPVPVVAPTVQRAPVPPPGSGPLRPGGAAADPGARSSAVNQPWTDAGSAALAAGVAQRAMDGSVVFGPPSHLPAPAHPVPVQRATDPVPDPAPAPDPPPAPAADPVPPAPAPPNGGSGPAPAAPVGPQEAGSAHHVDDELVRALFPRLSRLLKAELRLDRERAGFLITTRH